MFGKTVAELKTLSLFPLILDSFTVGYQYTGILSLFQKQQDRYNHGLRVDVCLCSELRVQRGNFMLVFKSLCSAAVHSNKQNKLLNLQQILHMLSRLNWEEVLNKITERDSISYLTFHYLVPGCYETFSYNWNVGKTQCTMQYSHRCQLQHCRCASLDFCLLFKKVHQMKLDWNTLKSFFKEAN